MAALTAQKSPVSPHSWQHHTHLQSERPPKRLRLSSPEDLHSVATQTPHRYSSHSQSRSRSPSSSRSASHSRSRSRSRSSTSDTSSRRRRRQSRRGGRASGDDEYSEGESDRGSYRKHRDEVSMRDETPDARQYDEELDRQIEREGGLQSAAQEDLPRPPSLPQQRRPEIDYKPVAVLRGHRKGVACVKISPDGKWIASCGADCVIKIWDADTGRYMHTMEGHLAGISTIAWGPDSDTLASGSDDKSIRLWHTRLGKAYPHALLGHHNYIYSIAFSPKGNMLVSGSYDEAVFIWDVRSGTVMRSLPAHSDPVAGVDFVRDGTLIVSCAGDGLIRIWDTATGQCLRTLVHEDNPPVVAVRFAPNGKFVLAWTLDECVRLWNYVEGRCVKTYQGHRNKRFSLGGAVGRYEGGGFVASGSEDGKVVVWDVKSKAVLQELEGHADVVLGVDVHPTKRIMVSCGLDKTIRIWRDTS
ncbi:MAG: WD domain protein [Vezdaea aestivalis]|nr:MAG: WD domain protein [Vezdaea aestivalis]